MADGIAAVVGNHDYGIYSDPSHKRPSGEILSDVIKEEKTMGWNVLMDENIKISRNQDSIAVVGVQNTSPSSHFPSKGNLNKASEGTEGMFRILLTHDPMHWEAEILGKRSVFIPVPEKGNAKECSNYRTHLTC